ncbi:MAG TPA: Na+:solute symporter [Bacteroidales bacterium]|nr:Na+:solute symporter [Bacteroidales bacterium]
MHLVLTDWLIIGAYLVVMILITIILSRRAGKSTGEFFLSGRSLPWYIAGTSMVATTFAADTPLAVTELVATRGIAGNWLWWNMLVGGMLTVFFFARLWRRAGIMTDCEFVSIRYSGGAARFLRGFRAVYIGIVMNMIVIAWVNLAMAKILAVVFPGFTLFGHASFTLWGMVFSSHLILVGFLTLFVAFYSSLSGLWGVTITDAVQFGLAMTGCIVLAVLAVNHADVGGVAGLKASLPAEVFNYFPVVGKGSQGAGALQLTLLAFIAYIGVQWWASWYPGSEPGGGGYVAQRMMSAKNEKHSLLATLWFTIAHYALRPWPWIVVALAALAVMPKAADPDILKAENPAYYEVAARQFSGQPLQGADVVTAAEPAFAGYYDKYENTVDPGRMYPKLMVKYMPKGLLGLLLAAFFAAFMSTVASQTVWGTSYIINDLVRPFIRKNGTEKYYVRISRFTTVLLLILGFIVTTRLTLISDAWKFILACSGGIGLVLIFRWFWWRINAWSEISAMLAPFIVYPLLYQPAVLEFFTGNTTPLPYELVLIIIVVWATIVWLLVTLFTRPTREQTLLDFYRRVHPGGAGWRRISKQLPEVKGDTGYGYLFLNWIAGSVMVLFILFAIGKFIFAEYTSALIYLSISIIAAIFIYYSMKRIGWSKVVE